jgi:DNA-binding MarR family transcriptional regulator
MYAYNVSRKTPVSTARKTKPELAELESLYRRPGFMLRRAHQIAESVFCDECTGLDLTPAQCGALVVTRACPWLDQTGLGLAMGFDRATMGEILRKLETRDLIARKASATDARRRQIALTTRGEEVLRRIPLALQRAQERLLAPYSAAERELLLSLLARMCQAFNSTTRSPLVRPRQPQESAAPETRARTRRNAALPSDS